MILKIYDPQASIVKPRIISRMKDLGETFYVFFVILMISSMLGIVLEVTISPPYVIFSICDVSLRQLTSFCEKLKFWVPHFDIYLL